MGGFQNQLLNERFKHNFFKMIVASLVNGCKLMVDDCSAKKILLQNHEEKIRTHLLENYLENDEIRCKIGLSNIHIRFLAEVPENYIAETDTYAGRTDIRVVSSNWLRNPKDYYIVECKRLDGTNSLNKKYVVDGICRFVGDTPKYSSYNKKNIMLGFIVADVDSMVIISEITKTHLEELKEHITSDLSLIENNTTHQLCKSTYTNNLSLTHIFYNISSAVS